jgi:uncharacterized membrane protein
VGGLSPIDAIKPFDWPAQLRIVIVWRMKFRRLDPALHKTFAFGAIHLVIAVTLGYLFTGSFVLAGALAIVEPLCNTVAHYFFDRWWDRRGEAAATAAEPAAA